MHVFGPVWSRRLGREPWVEGADEEGLCRAMEILGSTARVVHPTEGEIDVSGFDNVIEAVIGIIMRHPMREEILG